MRDHTWATPPDGVGYKVPHSFVACTPQGGITKFTFDFSTWISTQTLDSWSVASIGLTLSRFPRRSFIFRSCIFMPRHLVLHFQVLHFLVLHFQRPLPPPRCQLIGAEKKCWRPGDVSPDTPVFPSHNYLLVLVTDDDDDNDIDE